SCALPPGCTPVCLTLVGCSTWYESQSLLSTEFQQVAGLQRPLTETVDSKNEGASLAQAQRHVRLAEPRLGSVAFDRGDITQERVRVARSILIPESWLPHAQAGGKPGMASQADAPHYRHEHGARSTV